MSASGTNLSVEKLGEIAKFSLPAGWTAASAENSQWAQAGYSRDFSPSDAPQAVLSIFHRGCSVPQKSFHDFTQILEEPAHKLNSEELDSIAQVLSKLADDEAFEIYNAEINVINGRKILAVDGSWKLSALLFHGIFIKSDNQEVQEIFFEAAPQDFAKHINEVRQSIAQIVWS